jgi:hypothetical protein
MTIRRRLKPLRLRLLTSIPLPIRLPYGGWWINRNDTVSNMISHRKFEEAEWQFVDRFLKKGMTVVDIGAHHGFIHPAQKSGGRGES